MLDFNKFLLKEILLQKKAADYPLTKEILEKHPDVPLKMFDSLEEIISGRKGKFEFDSLILAKQEGAFFKPCPCTGKHLSCRYNFLNIATNCSIDCSYCILKGYLNNPFLTLYVNLEDMFCELEKKLVPDKFYRIGTGELTDSLLLEPVISVASKIIPWFMESSNSILELKTKTVSIDALLKFKPLRNIIVSWSLNTPYIIEKEEPGAASLISRLEAAKVLIENGYLVGFHFDPMIYYKNWQNDYKEVVDTLFQYVDKRYIAWISMGTIRYPALLDNIIRERHPESIVYTGELIHGRDGKFRYFRPLREKMFKFLANVIQLYSEEIPLYLCMESKEVWKNTIGMPEKSIKDLLDQAVLRFR